ncbi:permease [Desulfonema ishimotonii]|uniref:Permease n=1 Tax=Desulfonema ishimotonii TaxID=45657 RepID=A0A401FV51_9BACT|nr:permease [Desulfonema ishimotonii]GBC60828.1 permease [Desulfonema ishimotonii]
MIPTSPQSGFTGRLKKGLSFAYGELLADIGVWLLMGIFIAGTISCLVPDGLIEQYLGEGIMPMLIMLVIGMPVFVCATSSTPIVAALALKGLSPGAALVFLLAGPVTNAATVTVLIKILGKRVTAIYVAVIAVISLLLGVSVNYLYGLFNISVTGWVQGVASEEHGIFAMAMSALLVILTLKSVLPGLKNKHRHPAKPGDAKCCH